MKNLYIKFYKMHIWWRSEREVVSMDLLKRLIQVLSALSLLHRLHNKLFDVNVPEYMGIFKGSSPVSD